MNNEINFLYCGRLVEFRNPIFVIKIFEQVLKKNKSNKILKLFISGEGPLENECKQLISDLNIANNIVWMEKVNSWDEIPKIYNKIDILLALQNYSGWGMIIPEAMASGKAIISTNKMESSDTFIINGYNGFLVDINNKNEIESSILFYVDNFDKIYLHGMRSRQIIENFGIEYSISIFKKIFETELN